MASIMIYLIFIGKGIDIQKELGVGVDGEEEAVVTRLQKLYDSKIKPLEKQYMFDRFYQPLMDDKDFHCKPMVLLIGQYSVGKTSFIQFMLERDFPGARIGPEPTTDRFNAIMYGDEERVVPGNAAAMSAEFPFSNLTKFGTGFLNRFEVAQLPSPILEKVSFIDTPGILSGEKQRLGRTYDYAEVIEWWADRVDRILLLFDAHKLDISDEFKYAIESLRGNDDKIRIILNKADSVDQQQLMRIYGALMWSLGRVITTPESLRVYLGSFWDKPLKYKDFESLFAIEQRDLFSDLRNLPRNAAVRKINDLVKRVRLAKTHALLLSKLRNEMPKMFGKEKKKQELIDGMLEVFRSVQTEYRLPASDFPPLEKFKELLQAHDFTTFPKYDKKLFDAMEEAISLDIPQLMNNLPTSTKKNEGGDGDDEDGNKPGDNPFETITLEKGHTWIITPSMKEESDAIFSTLRQNNGKISGSVAKDVMMKSDLPQEDLRKIWQLADIDKDGKFDNSEFAVAMFLVNMRVKGEELPDSLPEEYIPPSKRQKHKI